MQNHITESTKKLTKKYLIVKFQKTIRTIIQVNVFEVYCQKTIAINIKHANLLFRL